MNDNYVVQDVLGVAQPIFAAFGGRLWALTNLRASTTSGLAVKSGFLRFCRSKLRTTRRALLSRSFLDTFRPGVAAVSFAAASL